MKNYSETTLYMPNGKACLECDSDFQENNHIRGQVSCIKCKYQSACLRAMLDHVATCNGAVSELENDTTDLPGQYFCICGFAGSNGNSLARHLASCERKSAYVSAEAAQHNTVKRNMLDMLGLVRRDGEDEEDSNEDLLIPADQQQQLLSKSLDRDEQKDDVAHENNDAASESAPVAAPNDEFNTQLSLDDLAPQSVAPPVEHDRTPQLSDEYQVIIIRKETFTLFIPFLKRTFCFLAEFGNASGLPISDTIRTQ